MNEIVPAGPEPEIMQASKTLTNAEVLAEWEAGRPVWTVEMGGISPGYEQCIQIMGFAFLKWMNENPIDWENTEILREYQDNCEKACSDIMTELQPSGAQFGAAMNIAAVFSRHGYEKGIAMVPTVVSFFLAIAMLVN